MAIPLTRSAGLAPLPRSDAALPASASGCTAAADSRRLHSEQLFGQAREVEIAHGDAIYRLRRTALGKLILTK